MADDDDAQLKEVDNGSKSGRKKVNAIVKKVNKHDKVIKRIKRLAPYIVVMCYDDSPQLFEILAKKFDPQDPPPPASAV